MAETVAAVVFAGGDPLPEALAARLPEPALTIAADSGVEHALALGAKVDLVVGDLDSADPAALERAAAAGAEIERHPEAKDRTDLELALEAAYARGATRVVVVGGYGGRLDHFLANALLLGRESARDVALEWLTERARLTVVRTRVELAGAPGDLCSLLAVNGPARGVHTAGLRYPLRGEALLPGSTRGVSNVFTASQARISLEEGTLLAVQPEGT